MLAVLLAGICGISALSQNEFHYTQTDLQSDNCNVCYDLHCYTMNKARCTYYSLANEITGNKYEYESQNEIIDEVDDMIFEYTEKASNVAVYKDCIPLISQYTNCNRDNICTGCKTCNCDSEGRWNCSQMQHCRPDQVIPMDHHTLVVMMEKLNDYKNTIKNIRSKRSVVEGKEREIMSPEEVLNWMYGVKGLDTDEDLQIPTTTTEDIKSTNKTNTTENTKSSQSDRMEKNSFNESEYDPLVFEDILNNLNLNDDKGHVSLEDKSPHSDNGLYEFVPSENEITSLTDTTILDDEYQRNKTDTDSIIDDVFAYINSNIDINQNFNYKRDIKHTRRLKKRNIDLQSINITSIADNDTDKKIDLQNIIVPLNDIVNQKQEELNKLIDIKEKLITYIKSFSDNINNSLTNTSKENITHLYFIQFSSLQDLDDFRKRDPDNINKYLQKFKKDIHEVVKDIAVIQRLSNYSVMPYDLKILIRAMRNYVSKENERKKIINTNNIVDLRKKFITNIDLKTDLKPTDGIIQILELLDHDMPTFNVLNSLTPDTRKILIRLSNTFYKNNLTSTDGVMKSAVNVSRNLEGIGKNWNEMTMNIAISSLSERLYSMRLFNLVLSLDIEKIKDTLAVFQFAQNRRMTVIDDITGEKLIERIDNDLRKSNRRFNHIIQTQTLKTRANSTIGHAKRTSKKKSFLQHIKTLLKNSKMDIRKLLHRKMPKSLIVKRIAKKKIDEIKKNKLAEYEQTIQRWQNNLNIISRNKRAAGTFQNFIDSIKNIMPGYRRSYKKKGNKTEKVKKRSTKRGPTKKKKISTTTSKTTNSTQKQK